MTRATHFDRDARLYDATRPAYPDALVDAVLARAGVNASSKLLELGAGTGKATALFARAGAALVALEPGPNMAAVLRERVAAFANVRVVETTFEDWTGADSSYDLVYAAQAIHWIDPAVRYAKIACALRPGGWLAVIRNDKDPIEPRVRAELDAAYAKWPPVRDGQPADSAASARAGYAAEIAASGRFGAVEVIEVRWEQRYTTREYLDLLATYSDHAAMDPAARGALLAAVAEAIDRHGGELTIPYVSLAFLAGTVELL
jgi:SAM-dependent methyltransferase